VNAYPVDIVRWVADDPQPGWIEAELVDAHGTRWTLYDKPPIFTEAALGPSTSYPFRGAARCEVVDLVDGMARIRLIDAETADGTRTFLVDPMAVSKHVTSRDAE
jgi:hypothetical protein